MSNSGDIEKVVINKVDYDVAGGADLARTSGKYSIEGQPTSGDTNMKLTKQVQIVEGADLIVDGANRSNLIDVVNSNEDVDLAYVTANDDTYTASGRITITGDVTQDAKVTVTMIPRKKWSEVLV